MDIIRLYIIICIIQLSSCLEFNFKQGKYMNGQVIETINSYGPSMCVRACIKYSGCYGVNYHRAKLVCELIEESGTETKVGDDDSFHYSRKTDWKSESTPCWPNPCRTGKKCVVTYNGLVVCVSINTNIPVLDKPADCSELSKESKSGIYTIYPNKSNATSVYCDMDTDGGFWTVFQKRTDASVDFHGGWNEYENGFGEVESNYWLGNANLNILTQQHTYQLRVDLEDWDGNHRYAMYTIFSVGDTTSKYTLTVGNYSGDAGDSLSGHDNAKFTTKDSDNDIKPSNCADVRHGAWWYTNCGNSNLNGIYQPGVNNKKSVFWATFKGKRYSLKSSTMMIRKLENSV